MRILVGGALALVLALGAPGSTAAKSYKVDVQHTSVSFRVKHLFTSVEGRFNEFEGTIIFDAAAPDATKITGLIATASIDTNVEKRDNHLRGADFFAVEHFPQITFESTKVTDADVEAGTAKVHGNLTIKDVTKPVVIDAKFLGEVADPWGNKKAGFSGTTMINRKEFGLNWNQALETGGLLVGEEVEIRIEAETYVGE